MIYHPSFQGLVNYEVHEVPDDPDAQVEATIALMRRYVREDVHDPLVIREAYEAASDGSSEEAVIRSVFLYIRRRVSFLPDEITARPVEEVISPQFPVVETLVRPRDMVVMCSAGGCRRTGDCDDFAMFAAALLGAWGIRSNFVVVAADGSDPTRYSHVYVAAYTSDGRRIPLDTSHGPYAGWEVEDRYGKRSEWPAYGQTSALLLIPLAVFAWAAFRKRRSVS